MSGQHTPGKLKTRNGFHEQTIEIFKPNNSIKKPFCVPELAVVNAAGEEGKANARRLVACWNMLVDETTEDIEANPMPAMFDQMSVHLEQLQKNCDGILANHNERLAQAQELHRQRDMLLAALTHIEGVAMTNEWRDMPEIAKYARAAIAKAEGCTVREALP